MPYTKQSDTSIRKSILKDYPIMRELIEYFTEINTATLAYIVIEYYGITNEHYINFIEKHQDKITLLNSYLSMLDNFCARFNNEYWKSIDGFKKYKISNYGRVMIFETSIIIEQFNNTGFMEVELYDCDNEKHNSFFVHNLVALYFIKKKI